MVLPRGPGVTVGDGVAAGPGSDRVMVSPRGPGVTMGDGVAVHSSHSEASAGDCRVAKREVSV